MSHPKEIRDFAKGLRDLMVEHHASINYTTEENGVYVSVKGVEGSVCIGWPTYGKGHWMAELNELAGGK